MNIIAKIFDNCTPRQNEDGSYCWEYNGHKNTDTMRVSYGTVYDPETKKSYKAHRLVCSAFHGEPQEGEVVNHLCCNPSCCNPMHLEWTTPKNNVRYSIVEGNRVLKLSAQDIEDIRASTLSRKQLIAKYNVSQAYISMIIRNERRTQGY